MNARVAHITMYSKRAAAFFALCIAISSFLYGAFLLIAVEHTASRAKTNTAIQSLSYELDTLQGQYLAATQAITPQRAQELGFVEPNAAATVFASVPSRTLSLNNGQ